MRLSAQPLPPLQLLHVVGGYGRFSRDSNKHLNNTRDDDGVAVSVMARFMFALWVLLFLPISFEPFPFHILTASVTRQSIAARKNFSVAERRGNFRWKPRKKLTLVG